MISQPPTSEPPTPEPVVGSDRVDLRQALIQLASRAGAPGGQSRQRWAAARALLDLRLVGEISLVVHSCLTDAGSHWWYGK